MKIDMHCHSYYSNDGISSPKALLIAAKKKGLNGIALTDHNTVKGWREAQETADKIGLILIPGEEIKIKENNETIGEILAYFINKEINPQGKSIEDIIKEIKDQNGIAIIAHPYHWKKPFKKLEEYKNIVDGIEVFNSRSQSKKGNTDSLLFAEKNNLIMTAGSDSHTIAEIGSSYIETEAETINDFKKEILGKRIKIFRKQTPFLMQISSPIAKILHLLGKPK
ncbi:MAG: PHP domain-containing protein [Candidatus Paceibacterota bacterium]|jgi:hypothetical protein